MDQEKIQENEELEETETPQPGKKGINSFTAIVLIAAAAVIFFFMMSRGESPASSKSDGCGVNFQSAWGQTPAAVWVDLGSYNEAKAISTFDITYPQNPLADYPNETYRAYSRQIIEVAYTDEAGKEGIRFSKAYTCNGFEPYEPEDGDFRSIQIMDVGGMDVKEYGDGEKVSILFFVRGDYSYTILLTENPMEREQAEAFVSQID
jgi:hypothetical protein